MLIINSIVTSEKDHNILVMVIKNKTSLARFGWQRLRVLCPTSLVVANQKRHCTGEQGQMEATNWSLNLVAIKSLSY